MSQAQLKKATEIAEAWQLGKNAQGQWHVVDPNNTQQSFCGFSLTDLFRAMDKQAAKARGKPISMCADRAAQAMQYTIMRLQEA